MKDLIKSRDRIHLVLKIMSEFRRVPGDVNKMSLREKQWIYFRDDSRRVNDKYATPRVSLSGYTASKEMVVRAMMEILVRL